MVFPDALVRDARQAAGLTQAELGHLLGMTQSAVAKLERAGANPTVETLDRVLRATGQHLQITSSPWQEGVDETLIAASLRRESPGDRISSASQMYNWAQMLAGRARAAD